MQEINRDLTASRDMSQLASRHHAHRMHLTITFVERPAFCFTVIRHSLGFMHRLVEAASKRDIDLLQPAADSKHWYSRIHRRMDQAQGQTITLGIKRQGWITHILAKMGRMNIGCCPWQQDTVGDFEHNRDFACHTQRRDDQRKGPRRLHDCVDILVTNDMKVIVSELPVISRKQYDRHAILGHLGILYLTVTPALKGS